MSFNAMFKRVADKRRKKEEAEAEAKAAAAVILPEMSEQFDPYLIVGTDGRKHFRTMKHRPLNYTPPKMGKVRDRSMRPVRNRDAVEWASRVTRKERK
jgi:hypothetical protein